MKNSSAHNGKMRKLRNKSKFDGISHVQKHELRNFHLKYNPKIKLIIT